MIRLHKLDKPAILEEKEAEWTSNLLGKLASGEKVSDADKSHYRHPNIKSKLIEETEGKCAYCESKLLHIAYGDVEHIYPKKNDPALTFKWDNLTLACDIYNTNKGSGDNIVDPYNNDPKDHFYICGPLLLAFSGDERAYFTQTKLDLNRGDLVGRRKKRIEYLQSLCIILAKIQNEQIRDELKADYLANEASNKAEYSALSNWFFSEAEKVGQF